MSLPSSVPDPAFSIPPLALTLLGVSAVLHASWNLLGKRGRPSLAFFNLAMLYGGLLYLPILLWSGWSISQTPMAFWGWLAASGLCQALYMGGLAWAYARGDISLLYPLARALPVVMVPVVGLMLALEPWPSGLHLTGFMLIMLGALLMPRGSRVPTSSRVALPALGFVLLAALGTTGYSLVDKQAVDVLGVSGMSAIQAGASFMVLQALVSAAWMLPIVALIPDERREMRLILRQIDMWPCLTGIMMMGTYGLVLVAMAMSSNVSQVVALRQLSIPIGVLLGILYLGERPGGWRLAGLAILLSGLVMVAWPS